MPPTSADGETVAVGPVNRPSRGRSRASRNNGRGDLRLEATLWLAADKLRGNLDAAEYKHVVLGLIFLKYISDAFDGARDVGAAGRWAQVEMLFDQLLEAEMVGQRGGQDEAGIGHQAVIVEGRAESVEAVR